MLPRYNSVRCGDCGRGLTWIEIAFGRTFDPVCGRCLQLRPKPEPTDGCLPLSVADLIDPEGADRSDVQGGL